MSIRRPAIAIALGLTFVSVVAACSARQAQTAQPERARAASNTSQSTESTQDQRAAAWESFRRRYWSAFDKWHEANERYFDAYREWLEREKRPMGPEALTEWKRKNGEPPERIDPQWLPEFRRQLAQNEGTDLERDIVFSLMIVYNNEHAAMGRDRLYLYKSFIHRHPTNALVGDWAEEALIWATQLGDGDLFSELDGLVRRNSNAASAPGIRLALARNLEERGDRATARTRFEEVLRLHPATRYAEEATGDLYEMERLQVGMPAPEFSLPDLEGRTISLASLRGKIVLLEFWATWCGPCLGERPTLREIQETTKTKDFQLIGVALDDDSAKLTACLKKEKIDWPQICDFKGLKAELAKLYHVRGIPRVFLIDRQGRIAHKDLRGEELKNAVATLLVK